MTDNIVGVLKNTRVVLISKTMKILIKLALFVIVFCLLSCDKDEPEPKKFIIDDITKSNYPKVDGSTSAQPLQSLIACKLLGIAYEWAYDHMHYTIYPPIQDNESFYFIVNEVRNTGTHSSFINLINGDADIIITAREASEYEIEIARTNNVNLIQTPIAIDAFIFILNEENPVNTLSTSQIRGIYTGAINNWSEVGGINERINPYKRNATSGSQVLMETLIMKDIDNDTLELPDMGVSPTMGGPFDLLSRDKNGICYTVYYYKEFMAHAELVKHISIDGVYPDYNTIKSREYPYTTNVYAVIREDLKRSSMAYSLYELLLTRAGSNVIKESGYVPY